MTTDVIEPFLKRIDKAHRDLFSGFRKVIFDGEIYVVGCLLA